MLAPTQHPREELAIGKDIRLSVVSVRRNKVRICVTVPADTTLVETRSLVTIVHVGPDYGSLRGEALEELGQVFVRAAEAADPPKLLVDLSQTNFFGARFLGVLCHGYKRLQARSGCLAVCTANRYLKEVLRATRLETVWRVYETRDEAIDALLDPGEKYFPVPSRRDPKAPHWARRRSDGSNAKEGDPCWCSRDALVKRSSLGQTFE